MHDSPGFPASIPTVVSTLDAPAILVVIVHGADFELLHVVPDAPRRLPPALPVGSLG